MRLTSQVETHWKILGSLISLIIIINISVIPIPIKICLRLSLMIIFIAFMDLFQKFSASFPISIQTALSYLGSQLAGFHCFYYTWFTIERIVFYYQKFLETNLNKNPNVTCALLFPEAFAPVILLTVFFCSKFFCFILY